MRQRVKIAGALVHEPPILLLDEPFNGMDPRQRLHMIELLRSMAAAGRAILFSSHILEEVERLAEQVLVINSGRLAAAGRLPPDPPAHDGSSAHLRRPLVGQPPPGIRLPGRARGLRGRAQDGRLTVRVAEFSGFTRIVARVARDAGVSLYEVAPDRRFARERLRLPDEPPMIFIEIANVTLRALLGRRRTLLLLLLAGIPIVVGALVRANGGLGDPNDVGTTLDGLAVRIILPLVALVFGTAALGSELEDGSAVHLLTKPIGRTTIVLAKVAVAGR